MLKGTYDEIPEDIPEENRLELLFRDDIEGIECEEIAEEEAKDFIPIAESMIEFAVKNGGMGLSAPQIGINKKLIIWEGKEGIFHIGFNPSFFPDGKLINTIEGCLSYPKEEYYLARRKKIRAVYYALNQKGKLLKISRGLRDDEAIVFQHEVQHLLGETVRTKGKRL